VRRAIAAFALVYLAAHLVFLPPTLEDIDSINFALGVTSFDVAKHQPHPPGYPVFIALAKISTPLLRTMGIASPESRGLAVWSALSGSALVILLFAFYRALEPGPAAARGVAASPPQAGSGVAEPPGAGLASAARARAAGPTTPRAAFARPEAGSRTAWCATVLTALCPLFWFTSLRPLSDMTGLAAAVAAQALIVSFITQHRPPRTLTLGAFVAGVAIGIRSQTFLLTLPLLGLALVLPRVGLRRRDRATVLVVVALGVMVWAIPLIVASGGLGRYAAALGSQAGEDFSGVVMLWNVRSQPAGAVARVLLDALRYSFVWPWGHPLAGAAVVAAACGGCVRVAWTHPRALGILMVGFVPYAVFHLLFHEVVTVRYALPLVVPVAYLAVRALEWAGKVPLMAGATALAAWCLAAVALPTISYGREGSPAFRAFRSIERAVSSGGAAAVDAVGFHAVLRRAAEWERPALTARMLEAPHGSEWLALVQEWRTNPNARLAFVADPRRTDLALFDPHARRTTERFRWGFVAAPFVGGARPGDSDVEALTAPGWMLDRGWALTAEVAGVTAQQGFGPHRKPSVAWIRTRGTESTLMLGGRHLGSAADPEARVRVSLQDQVLAAFDVKPGFFFKLIALPAGTLDGRPPHAAAAVAPDSYLPLAIAAGPADASARTVPVSLEQFDLEPPGIAMVGAEAGWQEPEYNPLTARSWRWMTERATLWVRPVGRDVTLTVTGESPLRYFDAAPTVVFTAGGRELARFSPSADFTRDVVLPADALAAAEGRVVIESDKWFVPGERDGTADRRHLALRVYSYGLR
jgi:hypothetical protein